MTHETHTAKKGAGKRAAKNLRRFWRREDGSFTIEAVIWTPIFVLLMAFSTNMSMVFFNEAQMLRVVQNVARAHSLGRYANNIEAENDVVQQLAYLDATYTVDADISGGFATVSVSIEATELMPMRYMTIPFQNVFLDVVSRQLVEY